MDHVTVRDLRNHGGRVLQRVVNGESLTITLGGRPVAELRPIQSPVIPAAEIIRRWRSLPPVDPDRLRKDVNRATDASL